MTSVCDLESPEFSGEVKLHGMVCGQMGSYTSLSSLTISDTTGD